MGKIKNQTQQQREIHNRAVKIRKMTDEELVKRFDASVTATVKLPESSEDRAELERVVSEKYSGIIQTEQDDVFGIKEFLRELEETNIRGIGKITIKKISAFAKEKGYI